MAYRLSRRHLLRTMTGITAGALAGATGLWPAGLAAAQRRPAIGNWGFDLAGMDTSIDPGDDFFRYAGGTWLAKTEIPADRSRWGAFDMLREKSAQDVREAIENVAQGTPVAGSIERKVVDYYQSYIDVAGIDKRGFSPAGPDLQKIRDARTHEDIVRTVAAPDLRATMPVAIYVTLDAKRPDKYVIGISQAGLGMPDRDYYLKRTPEFVAIQEKYRNYIATVLNIAGQEDPEESARAIYDIEKHIAGRHWPRAKSRDRDLTYNPMSFKSLQSLAPDYPWSTAMTAFGAPHQDFFVVAQPDAVTALARLYRETPVSTWRAYATFHYLNNFTDVLPRALDDAEFDFYGRVINGQLEQQDRWKRAVNVMNQMPIDEAVGQIYVRHHFRPEEKAAMTKLVENLRAAFQRRITNLSWMSDDTKKAALRKLATMSVKIGYPDKWRDYTPLDVKPGDAFGNRKRDFAFGRAIDLKRLTKPADKSEWAMGPQIVNAYHRSFWNEIVFPAAILQPPFFDFAADDAVNYGAIGAVIGHEMGHGFDDQGAKTDADGVLRNWWSPADKQRFDKLTGELVRQYSKFEALPGAYVNGKLTLGENIGDLGGLNVALEAWRISLGGVKSPVLDGFSGVQRLFLGFSQIWRSRIRDSALRKQLLTDPHSPARFRTNGTVRNMDAWYAAFDVKSGEKLYLPLAQRVRIW